MAQQVSLLPAVTLIAQVFFATFFGFLGLLLALPLTVVAQVWIREALIKDILNQWSASPKTLAAIDSAIQEKQDSIGVTESLPEKYLPEQKPDIPAPAENDDPEHQ
jgi:hypothetical protein